MSVREVCEVAGGMQDGGRREKGVGIQAEVLGSVRMVDGGLRKIFNSRLVYDIL